MTANYDESRNNPTILDGMLAGLIATVPMTAVMFGLYPLLPREEQYELPPEQITKVTAEKAGIGKSKNETVNEIATGIAHFGYGAAVGALYPPLAKRTPLPPLTAGLVYGFLVWFGSYQGWLPQANILPPATRLPMRRNLLMIAAHLVWGAAMAAIAYRWARERR